MPITVIFWYRSISFWRFDCPLLTRFWCVCSLWLLFPLPLSFWWSFLVSFHQFLTARLPFPHPFWCVCPLWLLFPLLFPSVVVLSSVLLHLHCLRLCPLWSIFLCFSFSPCLNSSSASGVMALSRCCSCFFDVLGFIALVFSLSLFPSSVLSECFVDLAIGGL